MDSSLFVGALSFGFVGLALYAFVEKLIPVLPSFPFLIFVGMFGEPTGGVGFSLFAITIGSTLGAVALFMVGRRIDERRVRAVAVRFGRFLFLPVEKYDRLTVRYREHGFSLTMLGQLLPGARNITPLSAGTAGVEMLPFALAAALSGALWNAAFLSCGYLMRAAA